MRGLFKFIAVVLGVIMLGTACQQPDPNQQIDEGRIENNSYHSEELGWTMSLPSGWRVTTKEETQANQERGKEVISEVYEGELDLSQLKNLVSLQKDRFNQFISTSEPFEESYPGEWVENDAGLKELIFLTFEEQGLRVDSSSTTKVEIDGRDFRSYEITLMNPQGEIIIRQLMYTGLINGLDFGVAITYNNEEDKAELMKAWMNSEFE